MVVASAVLYMPSDCRDDSTEMAWLVLDHPSIESQYLTIYRITKRSEPNSSGAHLVGRGWLLVCVEFLLILTYHPDTLGLGEYFWSKVPLAHRGIVKYCFPLYSIILPPVIVISLRSSGYYVQYMLPKFPSIGSRLCWWC